MPSFSYVAREAASGREVRNVLEANTEQEAIASLLGRNLLVVTIQEASGKKGKAASGSVPLQDLVMFTRQLATMIDAGLAIVQRTRRAWFGEAQFSSAHGMAERPCSRPEPARPAVPAPRRLCSIEP